MLQTAVVASVDVTTQCHGYCLNVCHRVEFVISREIHLHSEDDSPACGSDVTARVESCSREDEGMEDVGPEGSWHFSDLYVKKRQLVICKHKVYGYYKILIYHSF